MADVLTHVLVGYILGTLLSFGYEWLRPAHVTLVMVGALTPDLVKIQLIAPDERITAILGVSFSWSPLHTLIGSVLLIGLGALLLGTTHRKQALALFAVGVFSHHVLDILLFTPTGEAYAILWPFLEYRPPAGDLFLSSDRYPALIASCGALLVWVLDRRRDSPTGMSTVE